MSKSVGQIPEFCVSATLREPAVRGPGRAWKPGQWSARGRKGALLLSTATWNASCGRGPSSAPSQSHCRRAAPLPAGDATVAASPAASPRPACGAVAGACPHMHGHMLCACDGRHAGTPSPLRAGALPRQLAPGGSVAAAAVPPAAPHAELAGCGERLQPRAAATPGALPAKWYGHSTNPDAKANFLLA